MVASTPTDLIRNQLKDTAKARGIPEEKVRPCCLCVGCGQSCVAVGSSSFGDNPSTAWCVRVVGQAASSSAGRRPQSPRVQTPQPPPGPHTPQVISDVLLADQPTKQFVKAEELGAMVVHLCGPHSSAITGACISVDGGWTAR